ncbi:hypothetical protein [Pseudomonas sp. PB103]|uniref:hypothetical protein n=1 Tax=Pseudomonas sp. PB103 TaxID=2494698 RepID=UPI0021147EFA|nr:hypothetical protein [Pseudomonas sp. PB103]
MSHVFEGLATVAVIARYAGQPPAELTTLECPVRLKTAGSDRTRVELARYLEGPKDANMLRVILPDGQLVQGPIVDGCNAPLGGWLLIDVNPGDLEFAPPAAVTDSLEDSPEKALVALDLPHPVESEAQRLLQQIAQAHTVEDLSRASDRADGFVLGLETVKVLNAASIEGLYKTFEAAATARRLEHAQ